MAVVPDPLAFGRANCPDRPAVIRDGARLTFAELDARAGRLVGVLQKRGIARGERIAILAENELEYLEIQVAAMRAGIVLVPLNFRLAISELAYIVGDCEPRLILCGADYADAGAELGPSLVLGDSCEAALDDIATPFATAPAAADAINTILYTSGTTGRPKGAVISNNALFARVASNLYEYQIRPDDRFLQCLPLFHIASNVSTSYLYAGATNVLIPTFDPLTVLETIARERITVALLVPTMINALVNYRDVAAHDLASLHTLAYGASPIPPVVLGRALETFGCGFLQLFGMTETSGCTILRRADHDPDGYPERLASAGTEAFGFEVRIVDTDDRDVARDTVGEIVCRGPALMTEYWNAPEATAEALKGGWMHTGDLGYRDAAGYVYVTDRKKDMIVSGGENVYPREVEDVLFAHPDVLEAAVIGVPDERWGERVHAVLVADPGAELDEQAVLLWARERLAGYKVPKTAEVVPTLPKNATGKVLKTELRAPWWRDQDRRVT